MNEGARNTEDGGSRGYHLRRLNSPPLDGVMSLNPNACKSFEISTIIRPAYDCVLELRNVFKLSPSKVCSCSIALLNFLLMSEINLFKSHLNSCLREISVCT